MPRSTRTPSYRLHKPTGQAAVTLNGRVHYLGRHGSAASRERYDALIAEWLAGGRQLPDEDGLTVFELLGAYATHVESYYVQDGQQTGEVTSIKLAMRPLKRLYGSLSASEFSPLKLQAVRDEFVRSGLSRKVVNRQVLRVKQLFKWGGKQELVPATVYEGLRTVDGLRRGRTAARETDPVTPVPDEHVDAVRPFVSRQVWAMIELQRLTGMRSGEVTIMRARDLDTTGPVWHYGPASHKSAHYGFERIIEIGPRGQAVIREFLKSHIDGNLFRPTDAVAERNEEKRKERKTKVQPSQFDRSRPKPERVAGDRYTSDSYARAITRACIEAGVPHWSPHRLRHSFASRIRKLHGIELSRILCGHRSAVTTEIYAEADREKARLVIAKVG